MVSHKYNGYTFYVHNLGNYDIYFILKIVANSDRFTIKILAREDLILSCCAKHARTIKSVHTKNVYSIKLVDSYNILSHKLDDLGETFSTEVKKGIFPYKFMNKEHLFYVGFKPDISFSCEAFAKHLRSNKHDVDISYYDEIPPLD